MKKNTPDKQILLRDIEIFQDLTEAEVDALGEKMPLKNVAAKTVLYTPEEPTEVLFLIKKGRVRLFRLSADGRTVTTAILEKGTFFGQLALLGQQLYGNFAEALTDCVICFISRADAKTYLIGDARIAYRVIETLGRRLLEIEQRLADAALKHVPARVASLLLQIAEKQVREGGVNHPATDAIEINFTHEELAQLLGIHRETISRTLKEFSRLDLIRLGRGRIALLDAKGLLDLSAV
ncbi:Crp/Fnr family transcriptional regulator [soil metagenome]